MIRPIRYYGDPVLRRTARPVISFDEELERLTADMVETMHDDSGVGLAAPQVGEPLRLFVASECNRDEEGELVQIADHVFVNPTIVERGGTQLAPEGCLSVPGLYVDQLERDLRVMVRFQDVTGHPRELRAEGHFAQVIQHEYDHLEGILFFDRLPDDQRRSFLEEHRAELAQLQRDAKARLKELRTLRTEKSRP
ncbi:MAG: peptide deformylase [Trueperaceae bacterium]